MNWFFLHLSGDFHPCQSGYGGKFMPVYLVFLQVAKKNLQLALRDPNLPASLEACKL
jgi:hypothetical protein